MVHVYFSSGMSTIKNLKPLNDVLLEYHPDDFSTYFPEMEDDFHYPHYIDKDLLNLQKADVLISHIAEPTGGAICEYAIFATRNHSFLKPIIGYKVMDHPWLHHFLSHNFEKLVDVYTCLCLICQVTPSQDAKNKLSLE